MVAEEVLINNSLSLSRGKIPAKVPRVDTTLWEDERGRACSCFNLLNDS